MCFYLGWISWSTEASIVNVDVTQFGHETKKQKLSYHDSTSLRSVAQKFLTFNHKLKIHPAQSNLILQRILLKLLNKMSKYSSIGAIEAIGTGPPQNGGLQILYIWSNFAHFGKHLIISFQNCTFH